MAFLTSTGLSKTSNPLTLAEPDVGEMKQVRMRMVVDFPAPFGPRNPTTSPRFTSKLIFSRARTAPNRLLSVVAEIITSVAIRPPKTRGLKPIRGPNSGARTAHPRNAGFQAGRHPSGDPIAVNSEAEAQSNGAETTTGCAGQAENRRLRRVFPD